MCGRFTITQSAEKIAERFSAEIDPEAFKASFNAAPSQLLPVITDANPHHVDFFRWGLIPSWAKEASIGNKMINARAETLSEKPAFRSLLQRRRCLVIADGFYEWKKTGNKKTPYRFALKDNGLYAFAGLWDEWKNEKNEIIRSFSIITTEPNELVAEVHDRMPAILRREYEAKWLDKSMDPAGALRSFPAEAMYSYPVSTLVNSPANNRPELIEQV